MTNDGTPVSIMAAVALIRRLEKERDKALATITALNQRLESEYLTTDYLAFKAADAGDRAGISDVERRIKIARNKALDEAAELLRTRSFEDAMADAMMNTSKWSHAADAVSEACANAILALKSKEPT